MTHKISIIKATKNIALLYFSLLLCSSAHAQIITTVAGNGTLSDSGDGGPATAAGIMSAADITIDRYGNLYFSDNARVRYVTPDGLIHLFAGTGTTGYTGDGGPATAAQFAFCAGLSTDTAGNVFICDATNNVVRLVSPSGTISTFAGTGVAAHTGDGLPATAAAMREPIEIFTDNLNNKYVTESPNEYFRKIDASGIITTIGGDGAAGYSSDGVPATSAQFCDAIMTAKDLKGNLYIGDNRNQRIFIIDTSGILHTISGTSSAHTGSGCGFTGGYSGDTGPASAAMLNGPVMAVIDAAGSIYISDVANARVRKIDTAGIITTVAGTGVAGITGDGGPATAAQVDPIYMALDCGGNLYFADGGGNYIRKIWFDHRPVFTEGSTQSFTICSDTPGVALGAMLAVMDTDAGQTETWSILRGAGHGTLSGSSFITTSTGGTLAPTGYTYVPASGFTGTDTFSIQISDCADKNTATFYVTVSGCSLGTTYTAAHTTGLQVTPNPGNGNFTALLSAGVNEAANYVLSDVTGKMILSAQGQTNRPTLMQATAPPGIYVLQATTAHGRYTAKIQVE
jgi:Bacterial Ig domain